MTERTLYIGNKNYSSWSLRAWLALKQTGVSFDEVILPLDEPQSKEALMRHSPSARVPVLVAGELRVWESIAICEYLAEQHPEACLWPNAEGPRAIARAVSAEMHAGFRALRETLPMDIRARAKFPSEKVTSELEGDIARVVLIWRECRERFGRGGPFLFGRFSIADAMYAPVVTRFRTYGVEVPRDASDYMEAVSAWPAMREWADAAAVEPWHIASPLV